MCLQLRDDKESLIDDEQENLHGDEEILVVLEIQFFEAQEIFFVVREEVFSEEKILLDALAHLFQLLHQHYQSWVHLSLEQQLLGVVKLSVLEVE